MEKKISPAKVVVLGEARVGKTSLTYRFSSGTFNEHQPSTVDATCIEKSINVNGNIVKLVIWDTAGQERYNALNQVYYRGAEGAVVVYDATDLDSFKKMNQWVTELKNYLPAEIPIMIAGNKSDLYNNIAIQQEEAKKYAKSQNSQFVATSAKTGTGVQELFTTLASRIIQNQLSGHSNVEVPNKIGGRGALKVDGLDPFNPNSNLKLEDKRRKSSGKEKKKCC
ncbi:ras family gtpase [Stylonychia lemnae]|uniref:Ras family gtpase n=1 Tax=Stylonychia lemnae TaxID=5949 RepID=A0A078AJW8_STYLE|nr:ras family gtpase [Stylonychia lemnae]|eukprot:CDW82186.1 ras family gtpase [Stylonychia lemnae]